MKKKSGIETQLQHFAEERSRYSGAVIPPIFQNSLFTFESWEDINRAFDDRVNSYIYTRGNNPTIELAEKKITELAGGERAKLFGSGMAAISAAVLHYLEPGDHIITIKNLYSPTSNLFNKYLKKKMNIEVSQVPGKDIEDFKNAIEKKTKLIYLESPSTAIFGLQNIKAAADLAKAEGIRTVIDNTWATPLFQRPLDMGIDIEVHSCSKYIGGHSDVVAGVIIGAEEDISDIYINEFELLGGKTAPFDAWLLIRSLRTLAMRMMKHQENALEIAYYLEDHPKIKRVNYPGIESHPQFELGKKQMTGYSGLMSFLLNTEDFDEIKSFVNSLDVFRIGVSWGGHESLVFAPAVSYIKELSPEQFDAMGITPGDIRISVGLEDSDDLIHDLDTALKSIT